VVSVGYTLRQSKDISVADITVISRDGAAQIAPRAYECWQLKPDPGCVHPELQGPHGVPVRSTVPSGVRLQRAAHGTRLVRQPRDQRRRNEVAFFFKQDLGDGANPNIRQNELRVAA
jgi:hypothetical protein